MRAVWLLALAGCYETGSFPCTTSCESPTDGTTDTGSETICVGAAPGLLGEKCFVPTAVVLPDMLDTSNHGLRFRHDRSAAQPTAAMKHSV